MISPAAVLLAQLASISGDTSCPTKAAVEQRLNALLARPMENSAYITSDAGRVRVELRSADARVLARRSFALEGSCDDLARAVAVTVAAWEANFADVGLPAPSVAPKAAPLLRVRTVPAPRQSPPTSSDAAVEARLGLGALHEMDALSLAGRAELGLRLKRLSFHVGLELERQRRLELLSGYATYGRPGLDVALGWMMGPSWIAIEPRLFFELTRLHVEGSGFTRNYIRSSLEPAAGAVLGVALRKRPVFPWLSARGACFLREQQAFVGEGATGVTFGSATSARALPRSELSLFLGLGVVVSM